MSMANAFAPGPLPDDDGIPAADAGQGAPPPSPGFGIGGEEPDRPEERNSSADADPPGDTPFRTPDPRELGPQ